MGRFIDLTGMKFNKLSVIERTGTSNDGQAMWLCICECGNKSVVDGSSLRSGGTKTCGCSKKNLRPNSRKHGDVKSRLYRIWGNMRHRCYGVNDVQKYSLYGGRGITVCDDWNDYVSFKNWALKAGYDDALTIDRIDNNKGYFPEIVVGCLCKNSA